jgi:hypothetical protein
MPGDITSHSPGKGSRLGLLTEVVRRMVAARWPPSDVRIGAALQCLAEESQGACDSTP